jgi:hypothetical protein
MLKYSISHQGINVNHGNNVDHGINVDQHSFLGETCGYT